MPLSKPLNEIRNNRLRDINTVFRVVHTATCERLFALHGTSWPAAEKNVVKSAIRSTVPGETKREICLCFEKVDQVARYPQMALMLLLVQTTWKFDVVSDTHRVSRVVRDKN